jgi:hypothetical protein
MVPRAVDWEQVAHELLMAGWPPEAIWSPEELAAWRAQDKIEEAEEIAEALLDWGWTLEVADRLRYAAQYGNGRQTAWRKAA